MAVETNQVHSSARRGHEARSTDRSGAGSGVGKLGGQAPQPGNFLGLLTSLQGDDSESATSGQVDAMSVWMALGTDSTEPGHGVPMDSASSVSTLNLCATGGPVVASPVVTQTSPRLGSNAFVAQHEVSSIAADLTSPNLVPRNMVRGGEDVATTVSLAVPGSDAKFEIPAVSGVDAGVQLTEESAGKVLGKGLHAKPTGFSSLTSSGGAGAAQSPVVHWSKSLGDSGQPTLTVDSMRGQQEMVRESSSLTQPVREMIALSRPELATTVLFGSGDPRQFSKDEYAKVGRETSAQSGTASEAENLGVSADVKIVDPANAASVEEDLAKYWISGEGRHVAELKVDDMAGGPVEISIHLQGNEATIAFKADGQQAQDALLSGSRDLERLLGQEGMVLSGLSVGTSGTQGGGQSSGGSFNGQTYGEPALEKSGSKVSSATVGQSARRIQGVVDHFV